MRHGRGMQKGRGRIASAAVNEKRPRAPIAPAAVHFGDDRFSSYQGAHSGKAKPHRSLG
jgi:hypothetical protein